MSTVLNGLASQMPIHRFLSEYMIRSGFLDHYGWSPESQALLVEEVGHLIDTGEIVVEPDPLQKAIVTNAGTKLTSMYKVCYEPKPLRHGSRAQGMPRCVDEEMEFFNNTKWHLNKVMLGLLSSSESEHVATMIGKVPGFLVAAEEAAGGFYCPVFYDRVLRSYHEGIFSPTGSKMVRACLDMEPHPYTVPQARAILTLHGLDWRNADDFLANWEKRVQTEEDFYTLRLFVFLKEVEETGRSGFTGNGDITTSGPLLGGIAALDWSMLLDANLGEEDRRDCRETIARRIVIPPVLQGWASFICSKAAAKPLITRLYYGEAASSGADGMLWEDPKRAPLGWRSQFGVINESVVIKASDKWNDDYRPMINALGPKAAHAAFKAVSESYNGTFWKSYPKIRELRQRLSKAFEAAKKEGVEPYFEAPDGAVYTHHKWELDHESKGRWRFRHQSPKLTAWKHGIDISLQDMIDVAGAHSLFVRIVHFLDAWFKRRVARKVRQIQKKILGKALGMGAVHDCFIVPGWMLPKLHNIVRSVMHEAVELIPKKINEFLVRYGQEPVDPMTDRQRRDIHRNIRNNAGFLKIAA